MFRNLWIAAGLVFCLVGIARSEPSDFSLRFKGGPSFELNDWGTQARLGGEFDYDFGYSLGFNLATLLGISDKFSFHLVPSLRFDYLYIGPVNLFLLAGVGYAVYDTQNALDMRFGTGMTMPLGANFEFNTDINLFVAPVGTAGTPVTLDWLLGFGWRFR